MTVPFSSRAFSFDINQSTVAMSFSNRILAADAEGWVLGTIINNNPRGVSAEASFDYREGHT